MADISLRPPADPWVYRGADAALYTEVAAANCRPSKRVATQIVGPIQALCVSLDSCPPFVRNYRKWGGSFTIFDSVPGVGLGCLLMTGAIKTLHRVAPTETGNFIDGPQAILNFSTLLNGFATAGDGYTTPDLFGPGSAATRTCPTP